MKTNTNNRELLSISLIKIIPLLLKLPTKIIHKTTLTITKIEIILKTNWKKKL